MTEQDKNYIGLTKNWIRSSQLNEMELQMNIDYNNSLIANLQKQVENDTERLEIQKRYLKTGINDFGEWCKNNNINPSDY